MTREQAERKAEMLNRISEKPEAFRHRHGTVSYRVISLPTEKHLDRFGVGQFLGSKFVGVASA
jgi:hypothetical protein